MRICRICGIEKAITEYHKATKGVKGRDSRCSTCKNEIKRKRDASPETKEKNSAYCTSEEYKAKRRKKRADAAKLKADENKARVGADYVSLEEAKSRGWTRYFDGSVCRNKHLSERQTSNRSCLKCVKINTSRDVVKRKKAQYYIRNKEKLITRGVERQRERYAESAKYRASVACRNMLKRVLDSTKRAKSAATRKMIGYSGEELMKHLEERFDTGMSWDNYGKWHIDHIKPVSLFIKQGISDPSIINALNNLQPLWAEDNFAKRDNY